MMHRSGSGTKHRIVRRWPILDVWQYRNTGDHPSGCVTNGWPVAA
ncbi:MAG TPA: hypothetical protein VHO91_12840 [Rhodopila sp.]|nr:hypothetical protein [Rhodopila sp.]